MRCEQVFDRSGDPEAGAAAARALYALGRHDQVLAWVDRLQGSATERPCRRRGDALEASFELRSIGSYQPLLLVSDQPLPDPAAGLDADAGAALTAGAGVELGREIDVR